MNRYVTSQKTVWQRACQGSARKHVRIALSELVLQSCPRARVRTSARSSAELLRCVAHTALGVPLCEITWWNRPADRRVDVTPHAHMAIIYAKTSIHTSCVPHCGAGNLTEFKLTATLSLTRGSERK